jgi:ParB/RepB/Spo0J family partition protein
MDTSQFASRVKRIRLKQIRPSEHNPRGAIDRDESFERLVASINRVGILVPLVVRDLARQSGEIKYELVDGERRYLAARELALDMVPVHILEGRGATADVRKLMFHLHMTREQWGPMAQCRSLVEAYPELDKGLRLSQKQAWAVKLAEETNMSLVTARDRVHVLSWPKQLKEEIFRFDEREPSRNVYSYILAIEASIIEPSVEAFPNYFNGNKPVDSTANHVRGALLEKTIGGLETGTLTSREQIRNISPLFSRALEGPKKKTALALFKDLVSRKDFQFEDAKAEITTQFPELLEERPPKPQRVIAAIVALTRMLEKYDSRYISEAKGSTAAKKRTSEKFRRSLDELIRSASRSRGTF